MFVSLISQSCFCIFQPISATNYLMYPLHITEFTSYNYYICLPQSTLYTAGSYKSQNGMEWNKSRRAPILLVLCFQFRFTKYHVVNFSDHMVTLVDAKWRL